MCVEECAGGISIYPGSHPGMALWEFSYRVNKEGPNIDPWRLP